MTLSIYAAQSSEANRLKNGLFEIYYDDTNNEIVIKNGSVTGAIEGNKSEEIIKSWIELFYVRNNTSDNTSSN